jgi:hypothetical protein
MGDPGQRCNVRGRRSLRFGRERIEFRAQLLDLVIGLPCDDGPRDKPAVGP